MQRGEDVAVIAYSRVIKSVNNNKNNSYFQTWFARVFLFLLKRKSYASQYLVCNAFFWWLLLFWCYYEYLLAKLKVFSLWNYPFPSFNDPHLTLATSHHDDWHPSFFLFCFCCYIVNPVCVRCNSLIWLEMGYRCYCFSSLLMVVGEEVQQQKMAGKCF